MTMFDGLQGICLGTSFFAFSAMIVIGFEGRINHAIFAGLLGILTTHFAFDYKKEVNKK